MREFNQILPAEIISHILTRLPTESVLECKSVCKKWKNLIHHPSFPQMHLARLNHPDSTDPGKFSYVFLRAGDDDHDYNKHVCYFEYIVGNEDSNHVKPIPRKIMFKSGLEAYIVIGSFNGLICIHGSQPESYGPACIFNPVTREYVLLLGYEQFPGYETNGSILIRQRCHDACGFGYLAELNEYKVVRIYKYAEEPNVLEVEVYTVGSGKGWRHVGKFDLGFRFFTDYEQPHGVFLNGRLHWRNIEGGMVVVFDLAEEKFRGHIPPPPMLTETDDDDDEGEEDVDGFIVIGVSGGGILYYAVCQVVEEEIFNEVWLLMKKSDNYVMKEQEEHQLWGWSKVTSLDQREPFAFMEGGTVIRYDQGNFKIFMSTTSTWENIVNNDISHQVFPHKHTLVSLKELGEEDAEIMKSQGMEKIDSSESGSD